MQRYVYDDFGSGKCFLVEYQTADRRKLTQREITREQFEAARAAGRRSDLTEQERQRILAGILDTDEAGTDPAEIQNRLKMTEQERSELIESILDDFEALGMIRTGRKKPTLHPTKRTAPTFESRTAKAAPILNYTTRERFLSTMKARYTR